MKIEVLGPGCPKCQTLAANAKAAAEKLGVAYDLVKVTDLNKITQYGVMMTPALVVDGVVKVAGKVAGEDEIGALLAEHLPRT